MTRERLADERISAWLRNEAPDQLPDRVLQATFERTRPTRQRRTFLGWRTPQMLRSTTAIAVGAAAIVLLVMGVGILQRGYLGIGDRPSPASSARPTVEPTLQPTLDPGATPGPISLTGQLAFSRTTDGDTDLYLMNLDRTGLVRLTEGPEDDLQPAWSPDGRTLYFARKAATNPNESDIYALDVASGALMQLTSEPGVEGEPRVSADGRIVFEAWPDSPGNYVMNADGTDRRRIFEAPDDTYVLIGWSGDGTAFYLIRSGLEVLRVEVETGNVSSVISAGNEEISLSPDGTTFAFQSQGLVPPGIYLMDADGSNIRHLTGSWADGGPIQWAPDGEHLVFKLSDGWLYLVGADGTGLTRWLEGVSGFAWRPN